MRYKDLGEIKREIELLRAFAAMAPDIVAVVKEYDGKQFNKKFMTALQEIRGKNGEYLCCGYIMTDYYFSIGLTKKTEYRYDNIANVTAMGGKRPWVKLIGKTERINASVIVESINENAKNFLEHAENMEKQTAKIDSMIDEYNKYIDACNNIYLEIDPAFDRIFRYGVRHSHI